eukprot:CAMPEP_0174863254 /NCGR_PEP_ID=MMETSP1114-20130205/55842_1 /TAXON_ID=312471 /ORGANISM="Neobodo designis, Strain CCAP 1951/1" /LENGTH=398 /DNA_ID=CAMNT_0016098319 /DNA_START=98 /DNA_END=1291 /DNA_ORIENTATION=+
MAGVGAGTHLLSTGMAVAIAGTGITVAATLPQLLSVLTPTGVKRIRAYRDDGRAPTRVRKVYTHCRRAMGAPPMGPVAIFCRAELLAGPCWALFYEAMLAHTSLGRAAKEAIAAGVSDANACGFCATAHGGMIDAIAAAEPAAAEDARLTVPDLIAVRRWATTTRAMASGKPGVGDASPLPFSAAQAPEAVSVVVLFNFVNRLVDLFADDRVLPQRMLPAPLFRTVWPLLARYLRNSLAIHNEPGASFREAVAASDPSLRSSDTPVERVEEELPSRLRAALAPNPHILLAAEAWSRACARDVRAALRKESRDVLRKFVVAWDGSKGGLSTQWATDVAATSPHEMDRLLLRIALLTIAGPYQVTDADIAAAISARGEEAVVLVSCFAAAEAAKRIGDGT